MTIRQLIGRFGKPLVMVAICVFAFLTVRKSLPDMAKLHPRDYGLLAAGMALFIVSYVVQAIGWHFVLRALGQPIKFRDSARMFFISLIARWLPGRIWYTGTRLYIGRQVGISVAAVGFGTILELIYLLMGGIVVTVAFAGSILRGVISSPHGQIVLWSGVGLIIVGGMLVIRPSTFTSLSRLRPVRKVFDKLSGGEMDGAHVPDMSTASSLLLILYFTLYWVYSGVAFGVLAAAFMPMTTARWFACLPGFSGSWLIGFFSMITPAGIGIREFAMTVMLKGSMGQSAALLMSIASRLAMTFTELILAGIAYFFLHNQLGEMPYAGAKNRYATAKTTHPPSTTGLTFELPADILPDSYELLHAPKPPSKTTIER